MPTRNNNPTAWSDPYGLCVPLCSALIGALAGGIGAAVGTMIYNKATGRPVTDNVLRNGGVGAGVGAIAGLGYGLVGPGGAGAAAAPISTNVDRIAAEAQAAGSTIGQQIGAVSRIVGKMRLGQDAAVEAISQSIRRFADVGPTITLGGNRYVLAARAGAEGVVNAIGVNSKGETFRAAVTMGEKGWELVK